MTARFLNVGACRATPRAGSAAVEFALVGPLLILLLTGMLVYGGWFWLAQCVQSLASESARAAVAGLDADERRALARAYVDQEGAEVYGFDPGALDVEVAATADVIRVRIAFDASDHPMMLLAAVVPAPPMRIERSAVVRLGGF